MSDIAIRVKNLSKQYRIGGPSAGLRTGQQARYKTIRESLTEALKAPFRRLSSVVRGQSSIISNEMIWALKDVSFEVKRGEVVGIIGRNGAGKTTLLKVLSRITEPTEGYAEIHGRVGSLLEVGTGFHPELTGRENVYLNGAILGMRRAEIEHKFDEIVAFAEIEKFLDTPVKHYSSGMYVRLAFAVAAHLEPEILLVDEVLAVGDAAFQKKCLGKMGDVAREGRTVLFVSHNMAAIENLCSRAILLRSGCLWLDDFSASVVSQYVKVDTPCLADGLAYGVKDSLLKGSGILGIRITDIALLSGSGQPLRSIRTGDSMTVRIRYETSRSFLSPAFVVSLRSDLGSEIFRLSTMPISGYQIDELGRKGYIDLQIETLPVTGGRYYFDVGFVRERVEWILRLEEVVVFDVEPRDVYGSGISLDRSRGLIVVPHRWLHRPDSAEVVKV
jgi:lipopolysaccharide transport system ATP-binding protein